MWKWKTLNTFTSGWANSLCQSSSLGDKYGNWTQEVYLLIPKHVELGDVGSEEANKLVISNQFHWQFQKKWEMMSFDLLWVASHVQSHLLSRPSHLCLSYAPVQPRLTQNGILTEANICFIFKWPIQAKNWKSSWACFSSFWLEGPIIILRYLLNIGRHLHGFHWTA